MNKMAVSSARSTRMFSDKAGPETTSLSAEELTARGYCRTSNAYRLVSRIDRTDWIDVLSKSMGRAPADFYDPHTQKPAGNWCDHYRRVHSEDDHTVSVETFKAMPSSDHNPTGFCECAS